MAAFTRTSYIVRAWSLADQRYVTLSEHREHELEDAIASIDDFAGRADDDWHHIELVRAMFEDLEVRARPEGMRSKRLRT